MREINPRAEVVHIDHVEGAGRKRLKIRRKQDLNAKRKAVDLGLTVGEARLADGEEADGRNDMHILEDPLLDALAIDSVKQFLAPFLEEREEIVTFFNW